MKLPWKLGEELEEKEEKISELENRIEKLEEERDSYRKRFEAEKDRRSELSRKKQEAEEERNRLKEKLESKGSGKDDNEEKKRGIEFTDLGYREAKNVIEKLGSMHSPERDLVTVYCPGTVDEVSDLKSLKNSVKKEKYSVLQEIESFIAFIDPVIGVFVLKMPPFFADRVEVGENFATEKILEFMESEKHWCTVSAGETFLYVEEDGKYEELERVTSRVNREHSKGGFSQGRFERKRDEQIENHIEKTEELLKDHEDVYILGDKRFCEDLIGEYLGGFDSNRSKPGLFYGFRFATVF